MDAEIVHITLSLLRKEQLVRSLSVKYLKISSPADPIYPVFNDPREDSLLEELHKLAVPAPSQIYRERDTSRIGGRLFLLFRFLTLVI
jgi:hypothetical protein